MGNNPLNVIDPDGKKGKVVSATNDPDEIEKTRKDLQRVAPGTKVDADGTVHKPGFFKGILNHLTGHGKGTELVSRIVDAQKTVVILAGDWGQTTGESGANLRPAIANMTGVPLADMSYLISFDPNHSDQGEVRNSDGSIGTSTVSPALQLAHELIHADELMRGGQPLDTTLTQHRFTEFGVTHQETVQQKELRAVGFNAGRGDITENQIRRELGQRPRAAYLDRRYWDH